MGNDLDKYAVASENRNVLKELGKNFKKDFVDDKPYESLVTTLIKHCNSHRRPEGDLYEIVERNGLSEPIMKMFSIYFKA